MRQFIDIITENLNRSDVWWHGTPSGDLRGSAYGLHLGSYQAAKEALEARIGIPAEGEWDGTRAYGKTLLAGRKTMEANGIYPTGYNMGAPEHDYLPSERSYRATFSDHQEVPFDAHPWIRPFRIVGPMTNTPGKPHDDFKANGYMRAAITKGTAKRGYYYTNVGEDEGSISVVVPSASHLIPAQ